MNEERFLEKRIWFLKKGTTQFSGTEVKIFLKKKNYSFRRIRITRLQFSQSSCNLPFKKIFKSSIVELKTKSQNLDIFGITLLCVDIFPISTKSFVNLIVSKDQNKKDAQLLI